MGNDEVKELFSLSESAVRRRGWFMAESPNVIRIALNAGAKPVAVLCEKGTNAEILDYIDGKYPGVGIAACSEKEVATLRGYAISRGIMCLMRQPEPENPDTILKGARRICVIYDVCDAVNIGIIFRTAAALGYDGVLLSKGSCHPLNRRSMRTSMGTIFQIPWAMADDVFARLRQYGFTTVATALNHNSISLADFEVEDEKRYALIFGSEGYGLPNEMIASCDFTVNIPMKAGVDSLNVGAAAAIILWHFRQIS